MDLSRNYSGDGWVEEFLGDSPEKSCHFPTEITNTKERVENTIDNSLKDGIGIISLEGMKFKIDKNTISFSA